LTELHRYNAHLVSQLKELANRIHDQVIESFEDLQKGAEALIKLATQIQGSNFGLTST